MKRLTFKSFAIVTYLIVTAQSFGKYQFDPKYAQQKLGSGYVSEAFFVPNDKVKNLLLSLIDNERSSILMAQYRVTDVDIARALCAAAQRGVLIRCITDQTCVEEKYNKLAELKKHKIPIAVDQKSGRLMHHKYWIFINNIRRKPLLWTGSANGSQAGTTRNQENVVVTENRNLINQFRKNFVALWKEIKSKKDLPVTQKRVLATIIIRMLCKK